MHTVSINYEIKEKDKTDGILSDEFKINSKANFALALIKLVEEGTEIKISSVNFKEQVLEVEETVEAEDENGKTEKLTKKVKKDAYVCTAICQIIKLTQEGTTKCVRNRDLDISVSDNDLTIAKASKKDVQSGV